MTKICFVLEELWVGGGPRNVYTLTKLLRKEGIDVTIVSFTDQSTLFGMKTNLPKMNVEYSLVPFEPLSSLSLLSIGASYRISPIFLPLEFVLGTFDLFLMKPFDAYIATAWETLYPVSIVSKLRKAVPLYFIQAYEVEFSTEKIRRFLANNTYSSQAIKFTHSKWVKMFLDKFFPNTTYYIGMGINHEIFKPTNSTCHKRQVLTIARCGRDKGFDVFVKAISYLRKMRTDFDVVIIGERQALKSTEIDFPYIFKGWINSDFQLAELYQESIFVNSGRWEALPMPPLEAMACGSSVVLSDMQGAREYAKGRHNCLLFPVGDYKKLAESINELLSNEGLRNEISKNATETAKLYDWKKVTERFKFMLRQVGIL